MKVEEKIEVLRRMLNEADKAKAHPDILLELSQLLDKYIVEYYKKEEEK